MTQFIIPSISSSKDLALFPPSEVYFPKILCEIHAQPLIIKVLESLTRYSDEQCSSLLIIDKQTEHKFGVSIIFDNYKFNNKCVTLQNTTDGAVCTVLMALDSIRRDTDIAVCNNDIIHGDYINQAISFFKSNNYDIGLLVTSSSHPKWSYISSDNATNNILEVVEKKVVSKEAVLGFYWFRNSSILIDSSISTMENGFSLEGNFYLSSVINCSILNGAKVGKYYVPNTEFYHVDTYRKLNPDANASKALRPSNLTIIIPAAGRGSRFSKEGWLHPKPLIDISGYPMIKHVLDDNFVSVDTQYVIALQKEHLKYVSNALIGYNTKFVTLDGITNGTATTVMHALSSVDDSAEFVVANSDQLVSNTTRLLVEDARKRNLDGSILVFRDKDKDPKWSFAKLNENTCLVEEVKEKVAISDIATVGIYYFRSKSQFIDAYLEMTSNNDTVNGEYYTCPLYNYMISKGLSVGVFFVDHEQMHGLGTPTDLRNYLKKKSLPNSTSDPL